jgi:hypothetical protein
MLATDRHFGREDTAMDASARRTPARTVPAAWIALLVKAGLGLWVAYALLTASAPHYRTYLASTVARRHASLGSALLMLALASIVLGVALVRLVPWARVGAFGVEGVGIVVAASRLASHPGSSLLSVALSLVVFGLLLAPGQATEFGRPPRSAAGA